MKSLQEKNQIDSCLKVYERLLNKAIYLAEEKYPPQPRTFFFHVSRIQEQNNEELNASLRILQVAFENIKSAFAAELKQQGKNSYTQTTMTTHIMHM